MEAERGVKRRGECRGRLCVARKCKADDRLWESGGPGIPDPYEAGKGRQRDLKGEDELQSYLEQAFGKSDVTSVKMRAALREWLDLYYGTPRAGEDAAPRLAALIVPHRFCRVRDPAARKRRAAYAVQPGCTERHRKARHAVRTGGR